MGLYENHGYSVPGELMPGDVIAISPIRRKSHEYFMNEGKKSDYGKLLSEICSKLTSLNKTLGKESASKEVGELVKRLNDIMYGNTKLNYNDERAEYVSALTSLEKVDDIFKNSKENLFGVVKYLASPNPSVRELGVLLYNVGNINIKSCLDLDSYFEKIEPEFEAFFINPNNKRDDIYKSLSEPLIDEDSLEDEVLTDFESENLDDSESGTDYKKSDKKSPFVSGTFSMLNNKIKNHKSITDFCFAYSANPEVMGYLDIFFSNAYAVLEDKNAEKDIVISKADIDWVMDKTGEQDPDLVADKLDEFNGNLKAAVKYFKAQK